MVAAVIAFTFGVWLLQQQAALPPLGGAFLAAALIGAGYYWRLHARGVASLAAGLLLLAGCAGAGFHWAAGVATWRLMDTLSERLEGEDIRVRGVVAELPERTARGWRFAFDVEQGPVAEGHVPRRVLLSWLDPRDAPADAAPSASPVVPGERWQFVVRLKRPH
ncbi:MAG: DUF4131 domain-containing protein, partial [Burkholderiales bacterium]|nr:DUF4131 domain-containing protein [Burkholderiales bacterium]